MTRTRGVLALLGLALVAWDPAFGPEATLSVFCEIPAGTAHFVLDLTGCFQ